MGKRKVGALEKVDADLPNLQHKIRRDPLSYREDFLNQYYQYESHREIFMRNPTSATDAGIISLRDLIDFITHVADCYPDITANFPDELKEIILEHHAVLRGELREKIVTSLVLLRKKEVIDSSTLLHTLFPLLTNTPSKTLRALLFQKIVSDLRTSNAKTKNHRLNRTIQTVLFNLLTSDRTSTKGIWAVKITRELWKRQIWTDSKAVEIMKEASLSENEKVAIGGVRFFLGGDKEREELEDESSDDDAAVDIGRIKHRISTNKKNKKQARQLDKAAAAVKRKERKKNQPHSLNFSAFHLLNDPQSFAEALFNRHLLTTKSKLNLEQKLLVLQLVSRLVGLHKLTVLSLYSYFLKYLTPRQPSVTSFLASLAQATHNLVPPDILEPLLQKIANEFVSEAAASEVAAAGLNAIREICVRQPLAMNETLLQDLVLYRKSKDKGVMMAAKGLMSLYREVGADLLKRRDRGKEAAMGLRSGEMKQRRFGEEAAGTIEGLDLLEKWKEEERRKRREEKGLPAEAGSDEDEDEEDWGAWDVEEDESDDSGGWINVESDQEIEISDSEDEKPVTKKTKTTPTAEDQQPDAPPADEASVTKDKAAALSTLATTKILTPADLAKLRELNLEASLNQQLPSSHRAHHAAASRAAAIQKHIDDGLTADDLVPSLGTTTKEERTAAIAAGKTDRREFRSKMGKKQARKLESGKSSTNKEKARRNKNFLMTLGKAKQKRKRSLVETQKALRNHVDRQKRGGRNRNG